MKEQTLAVQRMQDYIQAHLTDEITLADLGFGSLNGFTRAFQREFAITPSEYRLRPIPLFLPCGVWGMLTSMDSLCGEPVRLWLPDRYIALPEARYLMFRGERGYIEMRAVREVGP